MSALNAASPWTTDGFVQASVWGKDHWSLLAYVARDLEVSGGFQLGQDAHMRTTRRNLRIFSECPKPKRSTGLASGLVLPMAPEHGTILKDGSKVSGHDDYSCLLDMANVGFFEQGPNALKPGKTLRFSALGKRVVQALTDHKMSGKNFATFDLFEVAAESELQCPENEYFSWMNTEFNISELVREFNNGALRPIKATLDRAFIESFAQQVLGLKHNKPLVGGTTLWAAIDLSRLAGMPDSVFEQPVVFGHVGKNKGILKMDDSGTNFTLVDGNHRMAKAFFEDRPSVEAIQLSQLQMRKFKV